jgi:two-component system LytT family sensor kinase
MSAVVASKRAVRFLGGRRLGIGQTSKVKIGFNNRWVRQIVPLILAAHLLLFLFRVPQLVFFSSSIEPPDENPWTGILRLAWFISLRVATTVLVFWLGYLLPISRKDLLRNLSLHFLLAIILGVAMHFVYGFGMDALGVYSGDDFNAYIYDSSTILNFVANALVIYITAILAQQAYKYFWEARERTFRLQEAELRMLKIQLHPHFFFNTLNSISALMYQSPSKADLMITRLGDLFRALLKNDKVEETPFREELKFLHSYLEIHKVLMGKRLQIEYEIEPETLEALVPSLILQPIVENAIQHGLTPLEHGGQITIHAARRNGNLCLEVRDTGLGLTSLVGGNNEGMGLENTRARLENHYGHQQDFSVDEAVGGGVSVKIKIPFSVD